jgi:iron-sulfur cluster assembly protein
MITISPSAAEQIKLSAEQTQSAGMALRIAATVQVDESLDYGMGFDEAREEDIHVNCEGVDIVIAPSSAEYLNGAHLDFVALEDGTSNFIFQNPNDPAYKPPKE